jgi:hypothetical protein
MRQSLNTKLMLKPLALVAVSVLVAGVFHIGWLAAFIPAAKSDVILAVASHDHSMSAFTRESICRRPLGISEHRSDAASVATIPRASCGLWLGNQATTDYRR